MLISSRHSSLSLHVFSFPNLSFSIRFFLSHYHSLALHFVPLFALPFFRQCSVLRLCSSKRVCLFVEHLVCHLFSIIACLLLSSRSFVSLCLLSPFSSFAPLCVFLLLPFLPVLRQCSVLRLYSVSLFVKIILCLFSIIILFVFLLSRLSLPPFSSFVPFLPVPLSSPPCFLTMLCIEAHLLVCQAYISFVTLLYY